MYRRLLPLFLALPLILALPPFFASKPAHAASVYYVAPTGTDTSPCTLLAPCATIQTAADLAAPGDFVRVLPGNYFQPQAVRNVHGADGAPIIIGGAGAVFQHGPNPSLQEQQTPLLDFTRTTYLKIQGFTLIGMRGRSDVICNPLSTPHCAQPYGGEFAIEDHLGDPTTFGQGLVVDHNTVLHSQNTCFKTEDHESGVIFSHNHATDCGVGLLDHCYYSDGPNDTYDHNWCDTSPGYGIQSWAWEGSSTDNVRFIGNVIMNVAYGGIIGVGHNNVYSGNVIVNADTGLNPGPDATITGNVIQNVRFGMNFVNAGNDVITHNTIEARATDLLNGSGHITAPNTITDNILQSSSKAYNAIDGGLQKWGGVIDYNDYWQASPPATLGAHDLHADPAFVSDPTDIHLLSTSPCLAKGDDGKDIGAY